MGVQTIVHGRIILNGDFKESIKVIKSLKNDDKYPWIRTEMFSIGATEKPYYFEKPVITFGANYKGLEYFWNSFIIKFENILKKIEFDSVKIEMETEFMGTYNFFWKSKTKNESKKDNQIHLLETEKWYFGFGHRDILGNLDEELKPEHIFDINFEYPNLLNIQTKIEFDSLIKNLELNVKEFSVKKMDYEKLHPILTYYSIENKINYGFEEGKGLWITKLKIN